MMHWMMMTYRIGVLFVDFVCLVLKCLWLLLLSFFRVLVPPEMKSVEGETVLITGSGHGIGKELALQFARLGARIICLDLNEEWNKQTAAQIAKEGGVAWAFQCDVTKREQIKDVSDKIRRTIGDVTFIINNTGILPCKPILDHTPQDIKNTFDVNVFSQFWVLQEWLPTLMKKRRGHIVAMSSVCGVTGSPNTVVYCSSKFAVTGLMESLLEELRCSKEYSNIKLTRIHPFIIGTGLVKNPRIRFPSLNRIVSPHECASLIIKSVRRDEEVAFIPYNYYYIHIFVGSLPRSVQKAIIDFLGVRLETHKD